MKPRIRWLKPVAGFSLFTQAIAFIYYGGEAILMIVGIFLFIFSIAIVCIGLDHLISVLDLVPNLMLSSFLLNSVFPALDITTETTWSQYLWDNLYSPQVFLLDFCKSFPSYCYWYICLSYELTYKIYFICKFIFSTVVLTLVIWFSASII
jgi:hypothetical protein